VRGKIQELMAVKPEDHFQTGAVTGQLERTDNHRTITQKPTIMQGFDKNRIVVIESDRKRRNQLRSILGSLGYVPFCFEKETICMDNIDNLKADMVIAASLPLIRVIRFLGAFEKKDCRMPVLIISDDIHIQDFIKENFCVAVHIINEIKHLSVFENLVRKMLGSEFAAMPSAETYGLIGNSRAIAGIKKRIQNLRSLPDAVLIHGEPGTGKEKIARAIHYYSQRKNGPFVKVDSTLFAENFAGSDFLDRLSQNKRKNLNITRDIFKSAHRGTLFIQEIGDMPFRIQADMLCFVGEQRATDQSSCLKDDFDVRVIASTTRRLEHLIALGKFRKDLFFRLNVFNIKMPLLRNRREDILPLADFFNAGYCKELKKPVMNMRPHIKKILHAYSWPGNVRELEMLMKRFVLSGNETVFRDYFKMTETMPDESDPLRIMQSFAESCGLARNPDLQKYLDDNKQMSLKLITTDFIGRIESKLMKKALEITNWNRRQAAVILDISYKSLLNKIKAYKLA